jgi:hypothetical protein
MPEKSYDRIVVTDQNGKSIVSWERPLLGDLKMRTEGGKTIIEKTGWLGRTNTYIPSESESVKAEGE